MKPFEDGAAAYTWRGHFENGRARNPLTLCSVPVLVHVQLWVHTPGDPQSVNIQMRIDREILRVFVFSPHSPKT